MKSLRNCPSKYIYNSYSACVRPDWENLNEWFIFSVIIFFMFLQFNESLMM